MLWLCRPSAVVTASARSHKILLPETSRKTRASLLRGGFGSGRCFTPHAFNGVRRGIDHDYDGKKVGPPVPSFESVSVELEYIVDDLPRSESARMPFGRFDLDRHKRLPEGVRPVSPPEIPLDVFSKNRDIRDRLKAASEVLGLPQIKTLEVIRHNVRDPHLRVHSWLHKRHLTHLTQTMVYDCLVMEFRSQNAATLF